MVEPDPRRRANGCVGAGDSDPRREAAGRGELAASSLRIRRFGEGDEEAVNSAFNAAFGLSRSIEEWRWKYTGSPLGRWIVVGENPDGAVVTHFGALPIWLQDCGRSVLAGQNVDVFALGSARTGLGASHAYLRTARAFFEAFEAPDRLRVLFGFPGPRNDPLVVRHLGYRPVRAVEVWTKVRAAGWRWHSGHDVVDEGLPACADDLWERAAHRYPVSAVRDAAWYRRRFCDRPGVEYRFVSAWRRGAPHAAVVVRVGPDVLWVCDLVWDGEDLRALGAIDAALGAFARRRSCPRLETWLAGDAPTAAVLSELGWVARAHEAGLRMVARSIDPDLTIERLAAAFYCTMADADLV